MAIIYGEDPNTPLNVLDYNSLAYKQENFHQTVTLARRRPKFVEHDLATNTSSNTANFDVFSCSDKIVRVWTDGGHLWSQALLSENDNETTLNSWSTKVDVSPSVTDYLAVAPSLIGYETGGVSTLWKVAVAETGGHLRMFQSTDAVTWTEVTAVHSAVMAGLDAFTRPNNWYSVNEITFVGLAAGPVEVIYYWTTDSVHNSRLLYYFNGRLYSTDIAYPYTITGFDVQVVNDPNFDKIPLNATIAGYQAQNGYLSNVTTRHTLVVSTNTAPYYTYTLTNNVPVPTAVPSGGLISWTVIPPQVPTSHMPNPPPSISVGVHDTIEVFQPLTPQLARLYPRINSTFSHYDPLHSTDTLVCTCLARDGDNNTNDTSYSYTYLAYYTSRDGIHWSQPEPLIDASNYAGGTANAALAVTGGCLVKCGHYLYLISVNGTMRSPTPSGWYNVHPHYTLDISDRIMSYSSDFSDMRQSRISVDNNKGYFWNTFLLQNPADFDIIYKMGNSTYQQIVSIEQVDTISPSFTQPDKYVDISSRGSKANLTDRFKSTGAVLHDNPVVRLDTFAQTGGVANSGLGHVAVQSGSWSTSADNRLHLESNFAVGVEFATFKDMVENGMVETQIKFAVDPAVGHAFGWAGLIFHGLDKYNWQALVFEPTLGGFHVVISWKALSSTPVGASYVPYGTLIPYAPPTGLSPNGVTNWAFPPLVDIQNGSQFGMRVEFKYNHIRTYIIDPYGHMYKIGEFEIFGAAGVTDPAVLDHVFTTGYVGLVGYGYSTEDGGLAEAQPTFYLSGSTVCGTDRTTFHITNSGGTNMPVGCTYIVTDHTGTSVGSGAISLAAGGSIDIVIIATGTLTLTVTSP